MVRDRIYGSPQFIVCNVTSETNKSSLYGEQNVPTGYLHTSAQITGEDHRSPISTPIFYTRDKNLINTWKFNIDWKTTSYKSSPLFLRAFRWNRVNEFSIFFFVRYTKVYLTLSQWSGRLGWESAICDINSSRTLHNDDNDVVVRDYPLLNRFLNTRQRFLFPACLSVAFLYLSTGIN